MRDRIEIEGTDLEVVAYVNDGGNLVVRVNKAGVCVADVGLLHAGDEMTPTELMNIGALTVPVMRDLRRPELVDLLRQEIEARSGS